MNKCSKCKGNNFIKSGKSTVSQFLTYHLCECGNVMLSDVRLNNTFLPSPEEGKIAEVMMEDAAKALELPMNFFFKTQEEIEEKKECLAEMFAYLLNQHKDEYDEEEYEEEYEDEEDEIEEFISFTNKIVKAIDNPALKAVWEKAKDNKNIYDFIKETEEATGISLTELMNQKKLFIDSMPEKLSQGEDKEETLAKLTAEGLISHIDMSMSEDITSENMDDLLDSIFDDEDLEEIEDEEFYSYKTYSNDNDSNDDEENKSYVILERGGSWKIYRNVTKAEISKKINDDEELDEILVFEIKPVKIKQEVKITVV